MRQRGSPRDATHSPNQDCSNHNQGETNCKSKRAAERGRTKSLGRGKRSACCCSRLSVDLGDEPVAAPGKGLNVARRLCVVAESDANLPDGGVEPLVEIYERVGAPNPVLNLLPSEYLVRIRGKQGEHFAGLGSKVEEGIALSQFTGLGVKLERSEPPKKRVVG